MEFIHNSPLIEGVQVAHLKIAQDERGRFNEVFRREWFPQVSWDKLQSNCSHSHANVLRGLHYHFKQVDYWYVPKGKIRAGLVDLRPHSPSYGASQTIEMGEENNIGLFIPIGVAHGFYAVTDCSLLYFVNNYYDNSDEFGIAWNDSAHAVAWGADTPILSGRDMKNPLIADIPPHAKPL